MAAGYPPAAIVFEVLVGRTADFDFRHRRFRPPHDRRRYDFGPSRNSDPALGGPGRAIDGHAVGAPKLCAFHRDDTSGPSAPPKLPNRQWHRE
jgi:hypothetical protein